jgi:hypothetical protein
MIEAAGISYPAHWQACRLLLAAWMHPSRSGINAAIWAVGLVLQCALVFSLFRKGIARRYLGFTLIAIFYPVRAALLFALSGHIDADNYESLYGALSFVEAPLQLFIAFELTRCLVRGAAGWTTRRALLALLVFGAACAMTGITVSALAASVPADHLQILMGALMLALFAVLWKSSRTFNPVGIAGGFALFSLVQLAALAGRTRATMFRDTPGYLVWSYVPGIGYLAIVTLWLAVLVREG